MIPKDCKRLAEVDFPIAVVSKHSAREKSIRHGHPSTLHLWWARRPLAACRAMLMALLLPDPCDAKCPAEFITTARDTLLSKRGCPQRWESEVKTTEGLRRILLEFIGDFANWDNAANADYLSVARALIKAAHPDETPLVSDPFAGGATIPFEALRIGCDTFSSDLNPVSCLIQKIMLEDIPRYAPGIADDLRHVGGELKENVNSNLALYYPKDQDGSVPITYLWARTVRCEAPNCGAEIPIYRSAWLCKRGAQRARFFKEDPDGPCAALIIESAPPGGPIKFRIARGYGSEHSRSGFIELFGTKAPGNNANVRCPCCGALLPGNKKNPRVPSQLIQQYGGSNPIYSETGSRIGGAYLLAVVLKSSGEIKQYRLGVKHDYDAFFAAVKASEKLNDEDRILNGIDEPLPPQGTLGFRIQRYGMKRWGDLFSHRQRLALLTVAKFIRSRPDDRVGRLLGAVLGRCADYWSTGALWAQAGVFVAHTFGRQALPLVWDFAEAVPIGNASGSLAGAVDWVNRVVEAWPGGSSAGTTQSADALASPLPDDTAAVWFTDPPYYDAVPYADLSDFFFVWHKRAFPNETYLNDPDDASNPLTPKLKEVIQDESKTLSTGTKDRKFFENSMQRAFLEGYRILRQDGIGCVVFAHKSTEGWEALLSGMINGGWTITVSWPIATERPGRLRSQNSAALSTSVHLVCRPRPDDAPVGDWGEVLRELPNRVGDWMERLQSEGIRGADLVFACIGPALEIFSRYRKVETADGQVVKLATYLEKVWEVVGRTALEHILGTAEARARNGMVGVLEEDARLTALFLWTLQSTNGNGEGKSKKAKSKSEEVEEDEELDENDEEAAAGSNTKGYSLVFDVVRRFAQPLGIELPKWEGRIIETKKGVVRLMAVSERANQLFGEDGAKAAAEWIERDPFQGMQLALFPEMEEESKKVKGKRQKGLIRADDARSAGDTFLTSDFSLLPSREREATTMDRVHAAMLLQSGGQANALRALINAEQNRGPDFLRLANALSALYPSNSEEKRLLDAMLLAVPR